MNRQYLTREVLSGLIMKNSRVIYILCYTFFGNFIVIRENADLMIYDPSNLREEEI
jgi:hypothetical protein